MTRNKGNQQQQVQRNYYGATVINASEKDSLFPVEDNASHIEAVALEPVYRDVLFSVLFGLHLVVMLILGLTKGSFNIPTDVSDEIDKGLIDIPSGELYVGRIVGYLLLPCMTGAYGLAYIITAWIIPMVPEFTVKASLSLSLIWSILISFMVLTSHPAWYTVLMSVLVVGLVAWYVYMAWRFVPFAAANLTVSLKGISTNAGVYFVAILISFIGLLWIVAWSYVANGTLGEINAQQETIPPKCRRDADDDKYFQECYQYQQDTQYLPLFFLLLSLYWTSEVLMNIVQVTVSGVIGTWCFDKKEASSCCSSAVSNSLYRSCTSSLGSICLGSLLEALIRALRVIVNMYHNDRRSNNESLNEAGTILICILECILRLLQDIIDYFNQWAYVYVGVYGYSYVESGRKVLELFRARGLTTIITHDLVGYVLAFITVTVGICTGLGAVLLEMMYSSNEHTQSTSFLFGTLPGTGYWAFGVGGIIGLCMTSLMMNVIRGAVNGVIVCFADSPMNFETNQPDSASKLRKAWVSVFPEIGSSGILSQPTYAVVV